ncbi:CAP domain-containing protein [Halobacillus mangrovi]|uniref:CAP domain-containing protein n=1 Tax=Halobacillus mangrovi TaxID=402384 RepID=UPI003D990224
MKGKSLFVTGALALSLLAAPATSLASSGDSQTFKVEQKNIQIDSVMDWVAENEEALKSQNFQQVDIQALLEQFQVQPAKPEPKPAPAEPQQEQPKQEQPKQEEPKVEEPKQEQPAEAKPAPEAQPQQEEAAPKEENTQDVSSEVSAFEQKVVELTNEERAKQGLQPLELDTELSAVAKDKSLDMQNNNYFSHNSPTYGSPFDMMKQYGIDYRTAGENIAMGQTSPEQVVEGWMNSDGHRKNIMNPNFTHIGVGHAENGNYWTQMFIGK